VFKKQQSSQLVDSCFENLVQAGVNWKNEACKNYKLQAMARSWGNWERG